MSKEDKFLDKYINENGYMPSPPDDRDFTPEDVKLSSYPLPEEYRIEGMPILDQGTVGSCVAHSIATAMGYGEIVSGEDHHDFSRGFIYANRRDTDYQKEGMFIRQALKNLNHCGDCEFKDFPWNEVYPKVKARLEKDKDNYLKKAEPFKILNYFRCYTQEDVKMALMNQGSVVIGVPVYDSFKADCPLPSSQDKQRGGHAMCVVGWDKTGWIIQNSWSKRWGNKGCMHLPYDYPIDEFWGLTVNLNVPAPKKENFFIKLFKGIAFCFKWLYNRVRKLFRKSK